MRARNVRRDLLALGCSLWLGACGREKPAETAQDKPAAAPAAQAAQQPKADFSGVVRGVVKLAPDAELPLAPEPTGPVPTASKACPSYSAADRKVFTLVPETRGLSPVHVALTQMTAAPRAEPKTREVTIDGCRLHPPLTAAMVGDTLRVLNRSDTVLMPLLPGDAYMASLAKGEAREAKLEAMGPTRIACGLSGYCGEALVITLAHPLFAVTDKAGEFEIKGVPLDQDLTVHAAHPFIGVTSAPVRLTKEQPLGHVELVLTPRKPHQPAAQEAAPKADQGAGKGKAAQPEYEPPL